MSALFSRLSSAARKRAEYRRTCAELARLPLDTALDLDLYRGDVAKIARRAVYGV